VSDAPFSRRALVWLVSISVASFATWLVVGLIAPEPVDVESAEADAYSRSAIGHRAFVELMRAQDVPVMVSRFDSGNRAGPQALLIVAEPRLELDSSGRTRKLEQMLRSARRTLLVLPKWQGREDRAHAGWLDRAELVPPTAVARALQDADVPAGYALPSGDGEQSCEGAPANPTIQRPQFLRPDGNAGLRPLITCANGWLLAEREDELGGRLLVLSDPDVLSNHGLGDGDNATVAWAVLGYARLPGQAVVLDETLHGHERVPSLWRELFTFPLAAASVQGALVVAFLVWAGLTRFGAPLPAPAALSAGKGVLVENTAALLRLGGHSAYTLARYLESLKYEVARTLHAPAGLAPAELRDRLRRLGRRRRVTEDLGALEASVARLKDDAAPAPAAVLAVARRVHRWRQEMLGGPERAGGS
jgi:hypothetical protein